MKPQIRRLVVIAGAGAAPGVAGCGGAASSQNAGAQSGAGSQSGSAQRAAAQPGPVGFDLSALATKLGVTESQLRTAMRKARPTGTPGNGTATDPSATLAKELGLSTAKVRAAMQALAPAGRANGTPPPGAPPPGAPPSGSSPSQGTSTTSGSAA